jgi:hypothetical protein
MSSGFQRLLPPDWRAREVHQRVKADELEGIPAGKSKKSKKSKKRKKFQDLLMQEYFLYRSGVTKDVSQAVHVASVMNKLPYPRAALRAFLIAKTPHAPFLAATDIDEETLLAYKHLFFDPTVFINRLIKIAYVRQLPADSDHGKFERDMMMCGLQLGWEYVLWKVTGGRFQMPVKEALRHVLTDSLWRSREHVFNSITDARTKESRAWIPQALKTAELLEKINPDRVNALEDLKLQLVGLDTTKTAEQLDGEIHS